jgi:SAM-dependent methyltransferase
MQKITRKNLRPFLEKHATTKEVLEIGGGSRDGNHTYSDLFPNRHTFDIDEQRQPDTVGDAHAMPFADSSYECILCTEVLEHLHSPWLAIAEMQRVLKPGGELILTTRFVYPLHDTPHDYYRYTEYGLIHLFKGWEMVELVPETQTMSAIGALIQRIGFQTDVRGGKITKLCLYALAGVFDHLNWLLKKEYGSITKDTEVKNIITTGYYLKLKIWK